MQRVECRDRRLLARTEAFEALSRQLDASTFFFRLIGPGEWGRSFAGEQDQRSVGSDVVEAAAIRVSCSPSVGVFVAGVGGAGRGPGGFLWGGAPRAGGGGGGVVVAGGGAPPPRGGGND